MKAEIKKAKTQNPKITKEKPGCPKTAAAVSIFLVTVCLLSLLSLLFPKKPSDYYVADVYQNGVRIMSIHLDGTREPEIITVRGDNGCVNEIEVQPDSIRILSADCPDLLCVKQGFIRDSRLPITCLPNRLVIQLRPASTQLDTGEPDTVTY